MIQLFAVNILPLKDEICFRKCFLRSSKERRKRADELGMRSDQARCIAAGLLLEYAYKKFRTDYIKELAKANSFGSVSGRIFEEVPEETLPDRDKDCNGKQYFVSGPLSFNLSHSGNYVICVIADREVGADIQRATRVRESLVRRCFSEKEKESLEICGNNEFDRELTFASIWTSKEATVKLTGRGIAQLLEKLIRDISKEGEEKEELAKGENICIRQGLLDEEYAWAVAWYPDAIENGGVTEPIPVDIVFVDGGELFGE